MFKWILFILFFSFTGLAHGTKYESKIKIWAGVSNATPKMIRSELTVFKPDSTNTNGSSVIICPGGSYCYLGMKHEGYEVAEWLRSLGFTAFVLRYRVGIYGNHYPAMIQDLQRSIELIRENCALWHLNPKSVGVMGFSAGGHLAGTSAEYYNENFMSVLGILPDVSLRPDFAVMLYPVISMHDSIAHMKSKRNLLGQDKSKVLENKMSLEDNVHAGMPPIFLMQAKYDAVVDSRNSYYFNRELVRKNLSVHYLVYNCPGHGFGIDPKRNAIASQWYHECEKWFETVGLKIYHKDNP